jgi:hypothetical protein
LDAHASDKAFAILPATQVLPLVRLVHITPTMLPTQSTHQPFTMTIRTILISKTIFEIVTATLSVHHAPRIHAVIPIIVVCSAVVNVDLVEMDDGYMPDASVQSTSRLQVLNLLPFNLHLVSRSRYIPVHRTNIPFFALAVSKALPAYPIHVC